MEYDYDLSNAIVGGELYLASRNSVHGWVLLADRREPLRLELTGNAAEDLSGHAVQFYHPSSRPDFSHKLPRLRGMVTDRHIGVVGRIDREGDNLKLEWYCQSGRIGANLNGFIIRFDPDEPAETIEAFDAYQEEAENEYEDEQAFEAFGDFLHADADPSYQGFVAEMEKFEDLCIEGKRKGMRIGSLFDEHDWPSPKDLSEDKAQEVMIRVLATLARFNIAFDMCSECTWQHAYQLIHDELADEEFHPTMKGSGWICHYSAEELCTPCREKFEKEWELMDQSENDKLDMKE